MEQAIKFITSLNWAQESEDFCSFYDIVTFFIAFIWLTMEIEFWKITDSFNKKFRAEKRVEKSILQHNWVECDIFVSYLFFN